MYYNIYMIPESSLKLNNNFFFQHSISIIHDYGRLIKFGKKMFSKEGMQHVAPTQPYICCICNKKMIETTIQNYNFMQEKS